MSLSKTVNRSVREHQNGSAGTSSALFESTPPHVSKYKKLVAGTDAVNLYERYKKVKEQGKNFNRQASNSSLEIKALLKGKAPVERKIAELKHHESACRQRLAARRTEAATYSTAAKELVARKMDLLKKKNEIKDGNEDYQRLARREEEAEHRYDALGKKRKRYKEKKENASKNRKISRPELKNIKAEYDEKIRKLDAKMDALDEEFSEINAAFDIFDAGLLASINQQIENINKEFSENAISITEPDEVEESDETSLTRILNRIAEGEDDLEEVRSRLLPQQHKLEELQKDEDKKTAEVDGLRAKLDNLKLELSQLAQKIKEEVDLIEKPPRVVNSKTELLPPRKKNRTHSVSERAQDDEQEYSAISETGLYEYGYSKENLPTAFAAVTGNKNEPYELVDVQIRGKLRRFCVVKPNRTATIIIQRGGDQPYGVRPSRLYQVVEIPSTHPQKNTFKSSEETAEGRFTTPRRTASMPVNGSATSSRLEEPRNLWEYQIPAMILSQFADNPRARSVVVTAYEGFNEQPRTRDAIEKYYRVVRPGLSSDYVILGRNDWVTVRANSPYYAVAEILPSFQSMPAGDDYIPGFVTPERTYEPRFEMPKPANVPGPETSEPHNIPRSVTPEPADDPDPETAKPADAPRSKTPKPTGAFPPKEKNFTQDTSSTDKTQTNSVPTPKPTLKSGAHLQVETYTLRDLPAEFFFKSQESDGKSAIGAFDEIGVPAGSGRWKLYEIVKPDLPEPYKVDRREYEPYYVSANSPLYHVVEVPHASSSEKTESTSESPPISTPASTLKSGTHLQVKTYSAVDLPDFLYKAAKDSDERFVYEIYDDLDAPESGRKMLYCVVKPLQPGNYNVPRKEYEPYIVPANSADYYVLEIPEKLASNENSSFKSSNFANERQADKEDNSTSAESASKPEPALKSGAHLQVLTYTAMKLPDSLYEAALESGTSYKFRICPDLKQPGSGREILYLIVKPWLSEPYKVSRGEYESYEVPADSPLYHVLEISSEYVSSKPSGAYKKQASEPDGQQEKSNSDRYRPNGNAQEKNGEPSAAEEKANTNQNTGQSNRSRRTFTPEPDVGGTGPNYPKVFRIASRAHIPPEFFNAPDAHLPGYFVNHDDLMSPGRGQKRYFFMKPWTPEGVTILRYPFPPYITQKPSKDFCIVEIPGLQAHAEQQEKNPYAPYLEKVQALPFNGNTIMIPNNEEKRMSLKDANTLIDKLKEGGLNNAQLISLGQHIGLVLNSTATPVLDGLPELAEIFNRYKNDQLELHKKNNRRNLTIHDLTSEERNSLDNVVAEAEKEKIRNDAKRGNPGLENVIDEYVKEQDKDSKNRKQSAPDQAAAKKALMNARAKYTERSILSRETKKQLTEERLAKIKEHREQVATEEINGDAIPLLKYYFDKKYEKVFSNRLAKAGQIKKDEKNKEIVKTTDVDTNLRILAVKLPK